MKKIILPLFALLVLLQWFVPGRLIYKKQAVLSNGIGYKFLTEPIDPSDPFIGKYITLNFKIQKHLMHPSEILKNEKVYVTFKNDKAGFAVIENISDSIPQRVDYMETEIYSTEKNKDGTIIYIEYPFTRFYMEESKAPAAEMLYGTFNRDSTAKVYALVALYKGDASIKDVYVNETSIAEMVKRNQQLR